MIYTKTYKMHRLGKGIRYILSGVPYEVVEQEAQKRGLTVGKFMEQFRIVPQYDGKGGIRQTFQPVTPAKAYKMRCPAKGRKYIVSGVPFEIIEREAQRRKLTVDEFMEQFRIVSEYDDTGDIRQTFQPVFNPQKQKK